MAWYRNTNWTEEIAADFERRIARSRHQKAQHLSLQGYHLILQQRAVALGDQFETPRALANLAKAQLALGEVNAALETFEIALERQISHPNNVAVHAADYLFLVGVFERKDRLPIAEPMVEAMPEERTFGPDPQVLAAKALIFSLAERDAEARDAAKESLPLWAGLPDISALGIDVAELRKRLEKIAGEAA